MTDQANSAAVTPTFNNLVDTKAYKFSFKTVETKDDAGNVIGKTKRPTIEFSGFPVPSVEGLQAAAQAGGKQLSLILEAMESIVVQRAREIINEKEDCTAENFPYDLITWEAIANQPEAERRSRGIPKEVWEDFGKDYIAVMPSLTGKTEKQVAAAVEIFMDRFNKIRSNKDYKKIIRLLLDQLAIYISNSSNAESYMDCVTALNDKGNRVLTAEEVSVLDSL